MNDIDFWRSKFETYFLTHSSDDGSHDISHFRRVWKIANTLSKTTNKLVILAACYFHDIVSYPKNDQRRKSSSFDAALKAEKILQNMNFPKELLENVKHSIEAHSFSANIKAETLEAKVVQDADRLESLGAIGVARTFYVAGRMGSKLFCGDDPFAKSRELNDKKFSLDHFEVKLFKVVDQMQTKAGRIEGLKRVAKMKSFLVGLREEII